LGRPFYLPAAILLFLKLNLLSAVFVILMTAALGLVYRSQRELIGIGYGTLAVVTGYVVAVYI